MRKFILVVLIMGILLFGCSKNTNNGVQSQIPNDFDQLNITNHQYLKSKLIEKGLSLEDAKLEAFEYQLKEVALLQKANELGIIVTKKELDEHVNTTRKIFETGVTENGEPIRDHQAHVEYLEQVIEKMGMTKDQYWNEYYPAVAIYSIKLSKLTDEFNKESSRVNYQDWIDEIVSDFERDNKKEIDDFKKEIGL